MSGPLNIPPPPPPPVERNLQYLLWCRETGEVLAFSSACLMASWVMQNLDPDEEPVIETQILPSKRRMGEPDGFVRRQ